MMHILKNKKTGAGVAVVCLALTMPGLAVAQHDMANMPGMKMPEDQQKGSGQPNKAKQKSRRSTGKPASEKPMGDMPGMEHGGMHMAPAQGQSGDKGQAGNSQQHDAMPGMEHDSMQKPQGEAQPKDGMPGMKTAPMQRMEMGPMQGGRPPPDARDPDAYAEGTKRKSLGGMEMADDALFGRLLVHKLEFVDARRDHGQNLEAEAWYGGDYNKLWLKAEGERRNGRLDGLRTEALWDRAFAPFWSTQLGVRHDTGQGAARNWLAFGVQGLAPYWFETEATAYLGNGGTLAARMEFKYELLLTQQLILQPDLEANFYSRNDQARGIGSGLSDAEFGLRLRYEIRRQFAPYIGVSWKRRFGNTAGFARNAGEDVRDTEVVAGVRIWF